MTDVSGIPNLGFGGGGYFGGIPNQQPAMSADQINASMWGRYSPGQAQATLNNIYGPQGFGGQTAAYAGLGAAYGRSTGGFRSGTPSGRVQRGPDLPDISPAQNPFINVGNVDAGKWSAMTPQEQSAHNQAVGRDEISFNIGNVDAGKWNTMTPQERFDHNNAVKRDQGIAPSPYRWSDYVMAGGSGDQMGPSGTAGGQTATPHNQMFRMPAANPSYFNPGIYAGSQGSYGIPYNGRSLPGDIGFSRQPSYPNLGYNPGMANWFANSGMNPSLSPMGTGGIGSDTARAPMGSTFEQPDFEQIWHRALPLYMPPMPPSTVTVPGQQGNLNWFGSPTASS